MSGPPGQLLHRLSQTRRETRRSQSVPAMRIIAHWTRSLSVCPPTTTRGGQGAMGTQKIARFYDSEVEREWTRLDRHRTASAITSRAPAEYLPKPNVCLVE